MKGWVRALKGHEHRRRPASRSRPATRCTAPSNAAASTRCWSSAATAASTRCRSRRCRAARGDGQPVTTLIDLEPRHAAGALLRRRAGRLAAAEQHGRLRLARDGGEHDVAPARRQGLHQLRRGRDAVPAVAGQRAAAAARDARGLRSTGGRILTFEIDELKPMANGGRGLTLIDLDAKDTLAGAAAYTRSVKIAGIGRGGKEREETLEIRSLNNAKAGARAQGQDGGPRVQADGHRAGASSGAGLFCSSQFRPLMRAGGAEANARQIPFRCFRSAPRSRRHEPWQFPGQYTGRARDCRHGCICPHAARRA